MATPNPVKVVIDKLHVTNTESGSEEFIYQVEKPEDSNSNKETMGGNTEESSTSSPLEVILVTTKFTDIFSEDNTLFLLEVTPATMEFDDVLFENLSGKLQSMRDSNTSLI